MGFFGIYFINKRLKLHRFLLPKIKKNGELQKMQYSDFFQKLGKKHAHKMSVSNYTNYLRKIIKSAESFPFIINDLN